MTPAEYRDKCKGFNMIECRRAQIYAWGVACMIPVKKSASIKKNAKTMINAAAEFFGLGEKKAARRNVVDLTTMSKGQIDDRAAEAVANLKRKRQL